MLRLARRIVAAALFVLTACDGPSSMSDAGPPDAGPVGPTQARVDYADPSDLYNAPWPDERLRAADGTVELAGFPNPRHVPIAEQLTTLLRHAPGFGLSSAIYVALTGPVSPDSLPSVHESVEDTASVFLLDVASMTRVPVDVRALEHAGTFGAEHMIAIMPLQGRPLEPGHRYAAVVTTRVRGGDGNEILPGDALSSLARGAAPDGLTGDALAAQLDVFAALPDVGVAATEVAATAVFDTWDPIADLEAAREQVFAMDPPTPEADPTLDAVFDDYCVFHTTVEMPDFQSGDAPYLEGGGSWEYDGDQLVLQRMAQANVWITIPRRAMPDAGFPTVMFVRTGGGGDRPLVDRGPRATPGGDAIAPGTGPAMHFARAGFAGISVDGPLGGLRNANNWDEQFAIFNINNPPGLRDNVRQSALELMDATRLLPELAIDASSCPGLSTSAGDSVARLDAGTLALMGHSMGATIAPLAAALEPSFDAVILSGAGASWSRNVIFKESPITVRPVAESILRYTPGALVEHDPILALLQWAGEPADPQVYARYLVDAPREGTPRHVLMFQGILDTYIPPPVANPMSLSLRVDLAGEELDQSVADRFQPLSGLLDLVSARQITLPVSANRDAAVAVVVQHPEDGVEDGHEVVFQTPGPQLQYRCFLETLAEGTPRVPRADATDCGL
ncbi:MAG: hypothetical protein AB7S26_31825 [Sandaracinaceae bacterium]